MIEELEQLAAKYLGEDPYRHEEAGAGRDPAIASSAETTARHDAMDVRVKGQGLGPGMKHGNGARDRSQPALAHGVESAERSLEEQPVALAPVRQKEWMEGRRHREDQVEVGHREKISRLAFHPARLLQALAFWAVTVPA